MYTRSTLSIHVTTLWKIIRTERLPKLGNVAGIFLLLMYLHLFLRILPSIPKNISSHKFLSINRIVYFKLLFNYIICKSLQIIINLNSFINYSYHLSLLSNLLFSNDYLIFVLFFLLSVLMLVILHSFAWGPCSLLSIKCGYLIFSKVLAVYLLAIPIVLHYRNRKYRDFIAVAVYSNSQAELSRLRIYWRLLQGNKAIIHLITTT